MKAVALPTTSLSAVRLPTTLSKKYTKILILVKNLVTFFPHCATDSSIQNLLIMEASRTHSDAPHSVGLLWTSDQPVSETST